jgi:hypothetical protein
MVSTSLTPSICSKGGYLFSSRARSAMERGEELKAKYKMIPRASRYFPILFPKAMRGKLKTKRRAMIPEGLIAY